VWREGNGKGEKDVAGTQAGKYKERGVDAEGMKGI